MMTTTFIIDRLECQSCALMIEGISEDVPGITRAEVLARKHQLVIQHDQPIDEERLISSLAKSGYVVHR